LDAPSLAGPPGPENLIAIASYSQYYRRMMARRGRSEGRVGDKPSEADHVGRSDWVPPRITSAELLRDGREIVIQHGADEYRLRLTSKLKLILTK